MLPRQCPSASWNETSSQKRRWDAGNILMIVTRPQLEVEERTRAMRLDFLRRYNRDELREQLYLEQEGICTICGKLMQDSCGVICAVDHATPVNMIANWDWDTEKAC